MEPDQAGWEESRNTTETIAERQEVQDERKIVYACFAGVAGAGGKNGSIGVDFLLLEKRCEMVEIRPVIMEQEKCFPLLQEIEPSGEMVERNLREGEFYLLETEREAVCAAVIIPLSDNTGEIKYLATRQDLRGRGYAGLLVNWLCGR